ncbi:HTH domain-containing protein [Methanococcoides sp. FTZ1]|uniref:HTH domain-containing protein n=1 Tax=Methanococcoides sp. FTZ1 TaxID=3439061 RepID=UPI003F868A21
MVYMKNDIRKDSISWHVVEILRNNNNSPMYWKDILQKVQERKELTGKTPGATLLSALTRNNKTFVRTKKGWYKLNE